MARRALLIAVLALAAPAGAEEALVGIGVRAKDAIFVSLDVDRDGSLSHREAAAHRASARSFDSADADRDGRLSPAEFSRTPVNRSDQPGWSGSAGRA